MGLTMTRMRSSADAEAAGAKAVDALGVKTMAELRARPLDQLTGLASAGLVVDGYVIPEDNSLTFQAGKQNAVDVLTGSNKDEANFGICGPNAGLAGRGGAGMTVAAFKSGADRKFGEMAGDYLKLYPATSDDEARHAAHEACADEITWNMRQWAAAQEKKGKKAYIFLLHIQTVNGQPRRPARTHTAEISLRGTGARPRRRGTTSTPSSPIRCRPTGSTSSRRAIRTATVSRSGRSRSCRRAR